LTSKVKNWLHPRVYYQGQIFSIFQKKDPASVTGIFPGVSKEKNVINQNLFKMGTVLTFIALFATIFGVLYVYYTTRHKERLALIEKGADASLFNTGKENTKSGINWNKLTLKFGMLFMGVALGIITAAIMSNAGVLDEDANYSSMIFLFGGLSLVLYYLIDRKNT
jgi:hypothetical protein